MEMWTSDQLPKCNPTSCASIPNATSSPASADGHLHSSLQESQTQIDSGQGLAHASRFPVQERDLLKPTSDTSGPSSLISSRSASLTQSLASKLQARLGRDGLMEYRQTWNQKVTPAGRQYWAHTASAHRISANDSTGWPTPMASKNSPQTRSDFTPNLAAVALTAGWPTPTVDDSSNVTRESGAFQSLARAAQGWLTPSANEDAAGTANGNMQTMLSHQALLTGTEANGLTAAKGEQP